jgi:hypothetical protein
MVLAGGMPGMGAMGTSKVVMLRRIIWRRKKLAGVMEMPTGASGIYFPLKTF